MPIDKLPADLPTSWEFGDAVTPNGIEGDLDEKHGYNYLMKQVNASQSTINKLINELSGIKKYPIIESLMLQKDHWSSSNPSTYTVFDVRYTATYSVWELIFPDLTEVQEEALTSANIRIDGTHDGFFEITAKGEKPRVDIPAKIKIERL